MEVTADDFDHSLKAWRFVLLAIHSGVGGDDHARSLAKSRKLSLFDGRRILSHMDRMKLEYLEEIASSADEFVAWARERELQPILRDLLVAQCTAFENFLKSIRVAARLASTKGRSFDSQIFVPDKEFQKAHKEINKLWSDIRNSTKDGQLEAFTQQMFVECPAMTAEYERWRKIDVKRLTLLWDDTFRLRNSIVHSRARPVEKIELDSEEFWPFDEAQVSETTLLTVDKAFRVALDCFRVTMNDL